MREPILMKMITNKSVTKFKKYFAAILCFGVLSSCDCSVPLEVTSIQKGDKKLACKDIILEINEAEHYRERAIEDQRISAGEILMPTCWLSGYVDGGKAIKSADARIEYLGHIYDLLDCGGLSTPVPPPPVARNIRPLSQDANPAPVGVPPVRSFNPPVAPVGSAPGGSNLPNNFYPPVPAGNNNYNPYIPPAAETNIPPGRRRPTDNSRPGMLRDEEGIPYRPLSIKP